MSLKSAISTLWVFSFACLILCISCGEGTQEEDNDPSFCESVFDCPDDGVAYYCIGNECIPQDSVDGDGDSERAEEDLIMEDGDTPSENSTDGDESVQEDGDNFQSDGDVNNNSDGDEEQADVDNSQSDGDTTEETGAYSECGSDEDCPEGYTCMTVRDQPLYGQCSKSCESDEDCPASPSGNTVACHPDTNMCIGLCGMHGGSCPSWLECLAWEFCLEKTSIQATGGPGADCGETAECIQPAECVEGESTGPYCAPLCSSDEDCMNSAPNAYGTCMDASGQFQFCMYFCGAMYNNAVCPGDMVCEVVVCR